MRSYPFYSIPIVMFLFYEKNTEPDILKVNYHPLYSMNKFVTNKSKVSQDGAQVLHYMG